MNSKSNPAAAVMTGAEHRKPNKKRAILVCTILAAVFIIAMAVVLMGVSDRKVYNDYMNQAQLLYYNKDYDGALAALRKASAVEQTDECRMLMADCYETQGNYVKALEVLRSMDTNNPTVSARIASIEESRKSLNTAETVSIAGRSFKVGTTKLVLESMGLTDAVIDEILQLYAVDSLSLANNELRDISALASLGGLVTLNLSGNQITDISPLASLTGLRTLYLDNNPVADLSPLYTMTNLTSLSLKNIEITESQLAALSKALPNCAIHSEKAQEEKQDITFGGVTFASDVSDLDLSDMGIRDISALANCQYLTRLNLSGNNITDLSPLMNLPYLQWLDISYNAISDLRPLMGINSLSFLNAAGNSITSTSALTMMSGLTTLYLDENPIRDFSGLRKVKTLTTLGLNDTGLTDDGLRYLRGMGLLNTLYIRDNPALTGEAVDELHDTLGKCQIEHSVLTYTINFDNHEVESGTRQLLLPNQGIADISAITQLPMLEVVDLSGNFVTNLYPIQYADCRLTIYSMNLSTNGISDLTPISTMINLETLDLSDNDISSLQPLMALTSLRTLVLTGNPLTTDEVELLSRTLVGCDVIF
ncbi:MAG: leucine-rich repeat domain-containing protein [Oscillospiraceae bacterium]|nr:leucine-rich repeat domain-containing protein [Oscillospiraceae bacterium]